MQKRGLSELIATVLIVLLVLAGVGITWTFIRGSIERTSGELETGLNCIDVELEPTKCDIMANNARLSVKVRKGSVAGFIGVVEFDDESRAITQLNETLELFSTRTVILPLGGKTAIRGKVAALLKNQDGTLRNCDLSGFSIECTEYTGPIMCVNNNDCDDSNPCTLDECNIASSSCEYPADNGADGVSCGTARTCVGGSCTITGNLIVFVTNSTWQAGALGGIVGADAKCVAAAAAGGLSGNYRAWLSDRDTNAGDRMSHTTGNYTLTNGVIVANGWNDLIDGTIDNSIIIAESGISLDPPGIPPVPTPEVVTATNFNGNSIATIPGTGDGDCIRWSDINANNFPVWYGHVLYTDNRWTAFQQIAINPCSRQGRLYCFEYVG